MRVRQLLVPIALLVAYLVSAQNPLQVGYTVFSVDAGLRAPVGSALFTLTNSNGVLVSQAGVGAVVPIRRGRIFVDEIGTRTGLALVNSSSASATVVLIISDSAGTEIGRRTDALDGGHHLARFVSELFPGTAPALRGSLTFESDQPLAAITLRESHNRFGEPLYATLPVVDLSAAPSAGNVTFPHIAVGAGFRTELLLLNPSISPIRGEVRLYASSGEPLNVLSGGSSLSSMRYDIPVGGTFRAELDAAALSVGWAAAVADAGNSSPAGSIIFRYMPNNEVVTEAGVAATASTTSAQIFVDNAGTRTGVAIANPSSSAAQVTLKLAGRDGNVESTVNRTLPASGHVALFAHELFSDLTEGFTGVMTIQSSTPVSTVTLKLTTNARNDQILTTLPVANLEDATAVSTLVFPHIAIGGEFSTRLIFINPNGSGISGNLTFYQSDGQRMVVPLGTETASQFTYGVAARGGRQSYPGNTASVAAIQLVDISSNTETSELVVNEGNTIRPRLRVVDSAGQSRDDFSPTYAVSNPDIVSVNADGSLAGNRLGFSTLTVSTAGVVATGTIAVVRVGGGVPGFDAAGVAQDFSDRLYMASAQEHIIWLAQNLRQAPAAYAGIRRSAGFRNDVRLQSQFNRPSFLAFNYAEGSLYVSDSANNVIRRVRPGASGRVETLAGTGTAGSRDGAAAQASFNSPQGVALDSRGYLWVADSGNNTIRRINLVTGVVETVAGSPGAAGFSDGAKAAARFSSPAGIAVETEGTVQRLERERRGDPTPPVTVIVADTGNGVLRRVSENGTVQTLVKNASAATRPDFKTGAVSTVGQPYAFESPVGVLVDAFQNVYVSEPSSNRVRLLLAGRGEIVSTAQGNTFTQPRGLSSAAGGRLTVTDSSVTVKEITYGAPEISSVTPTEVSDRGGDQVTIRGRNFAPDSIVVAASAVVGQAVVQATIQNTETIVFTMPARAASGLQTITVYHRGGLAQTQLIIRPQPLSSLPVGYITTIAGGSTFVGDGGQGASAHLNYPIGLTFDSAGMLYIADSENHRVRRFDPRTGVINTIAGTGRWGVYGVDGPATAAELYDPNCVAVDRQGNVFVGDNYNRVFRIDNSTGLIRVVAGITAEEGSGPDGVPATAARINIPHGLAVDAAGNVYISDSTNYFDSSGRVRKVDAATGIITTIAGAGGNTRVYPGDGGPAVQSLLNSPAGLALDSAGNLYVADNRNYRIRKIDMQSGIISTFAGTGIQGSSGDGGPATSARLTSPWALSIDADDNLYISDLDVVRKVNASNGVITTIAGGGSTLVSGTAEVPATAAKLESSQGVAVDAAGNVFISSYRHQIYRMNPTTNRLSVSVGVGSGSVGDGGPALAAIMNQPRGIAFDKQGNLVIADSYNHRIRRIDARTGVMTTIAGTGESSTYAGEVASGPATSIALNFPSKVAIDPTGNIYFLESGGVRKISTGTGLMSWVVSSYGVTGLTTDRDGNVYFSYLYYNQVDRLSPTGVYSKVAGTGARGYTGDNGLATAATLYGPGDLAFDAAGNLYIADRYNRRIRKVTMSTGIITTYAGGGTSIPHADTPILGSLLGFISGMAFDTSRNQMFLSMSPVVARIDTRTELIRFIAGVIDSNDVGHPGFIGDGVLATETYVSSPDSLAIDAAGNIYFADTGNDRIRVIKGPLP